MATATQTLQPEGPALAAVCIGAVLVASVLEASANNGWPLPLPTAWCLLMVLVGARFGGLAGGMWSAIVMLTYAVHTSGFTTGHTSASLLWGQGSQRIVAFGLAALVLVALVHNQRLLSLPAIKPRVVRSSRRRLEPGGTAARETNMDASASADLERDLAVLCSVSRRTATVLNEQLALILRRCEQVADVSSRVDWRESHAEIAAAAERCSAATLTLLACTADCSDSERKP
jgi:hypothetical protein